MKKLRVLLSLAAVFLTVQVLFSFKEKAISPAEYVRRDLVAQVDSFSSFLKDSLLPLAQKGANDSSHIKKAFLKARHDYKKIEWATEYFMYSTAKYVNGPPVAEAELTGQMILQPAGLQVIESYLFPHYDTAQQEDIVQQVQGLMAKSAVFQAYFQRVAIADWQIFDALKLEMFRIESLGITGFDNPLTLHSMEESAFALQSVQKSLAYYSHSDTTLLQQNLHLAIDYLRQQDDFVHFDRAYFITQYAQPITKQITALADRLQIHLVKYNRLLRENAATMFDSGAFNVNAFAPELSTDHLAEKIALGKKLFSAPVLSQNNIRSCATCHQPALAFTDGMVKQMALDGKGYIDRHTPTLINAALQPFQFYDQRVATLEDQISNVVHNPKEMHGDFVNAVAILSQNRAYQTLFSQAFPESREIDSVGLISALATYVRSLVRLDSRFDDYMRGDKNAMSMAEVNGFNLFMGKAKCGTCHFMPLFSGLFPPKFIAMDAEVIGVPGTPNGKIIDTDRGLWNTLSQGLYDPGLLAPFDHAFKTVSVRNAAKTMPYMHNGVWGTLEEVLDFYNDGGGVGRGIDVPNQTLSSEKLNLTKGEIQEIIAFIKSLDSK